ncbi:sigma factor-like helix-turn-helix DNA-binding protein [Lederbergia panacisoli]|uniref:sigma factor-like helix-turn-helix DNA-binding protein n=1 Tax=Lederbergia panacisoli TaxID=1255251 RepID=UPI00214B60D0|nr:sigma factor-like helix-turn-helix DNA-binding protein [Lederbergia panacisoli]MCR2820579.1 hypothetical protein [Lederbergia panacisoli]
MKTEDEKFMKAVENFCKGMTIFIKQLMRVHLNIERNGTSGILKIGSTDSLLLMQQQVVQHRLDKVSLEYGLQNAADELAKKELLQLSYLFDTSYTGRINKPSPESVYDNIAVQYCIHNAIVSNLNGVYDGDFNQYKEDAFQEAFFMVNELIKPFLKEGSAVKETDNELFWKFIMHIKKMLPRMMRHWYLTKIKHFKYRRKVVEKQKRYEKVKILSLDYKKHQMKTSMIPTSTLADKYGGPLAEQTYDTLIQIVKENNTQYAEYMNKHYYEGKTHREIAVECATKEGTVKSGVSRGVNYLRNKFHVS